MATATPRLMGAEVKRKEDPRLVTGTSAYVGDVTVPGLHYVVFVRSPHAHARVRKIDAKAALKRPGVVRVVTGEDLRAHVQQLPLGGPSAEGGGGAKPEAGRKHFPLSIGRVRHVGEPVAAVIATSEAAAVDGAQEVVVDWEPLPAVGDLASAMAKSAPKIHDDAPGNVEHTTEIKKGDPDAAFKKAHKVVKQRMISQRLSGIPMEPRATLAVPDPLVGGVTVWASHQAPHVLRNDLATVLGLPQTAVRVIAPEVGGGFGVKFGTYAEDVTLAACARLYKLPLRWTETRIEHMVATTHGRAQVTDLEAAVEADGTITAVRMHVTADIGAYPVFTFIPDLTLMMGVGVYKFTSVDLKSTCVFTNSTPVAAYRGHRRRVREHAGRLEVDAGELVDADAHHQREVGDEGEDRVGADVRRHVHAHGRDGAVGLHGRLQIGHLRPAVGGGDHVLDARLGPAQRQLVESGARGEGDVLRVRAELHAETAADLRRDHAHGGLRQAEHRRQVIAQHVRRLVARPH